MRRFDNILFLFPVLTVLMFSCSDREAQDEGDGYVVFNVAAEGLINRGPLDISTKSSSSSYHNDYFSLLSEDIHMGVLIPGLEREGEAVFSPSNSTWTSDVRLDPANYDIYTYIPKENPSRVELITGVTDIITFNDVPFCSFEDILISSGCALSTATLTPNYYSVSITSGDRFVKLMMDHVLAMVTLRFSVNATYNDMRTIEITDISVGSSTSANSRYKIDCYMNEGSDISYIYTPIGTENPASDLSFNYDGDFTSLTEAATSVKALQLTPGENRDFLTFMVVPQVPTTLKLTVHYNVYDKKGVLIRQNVTATNNNLKITSSGNPLRAYDYNLDINVVPTYLYQLSDNDDDSVLLIND